MTEQLMELRAFGGASVLMANGERAQADAGDLRASRKWYEAAYAEAERDGDVASMAVAVLGLGGVWVHERRDAPGDALMLGRLRQLLSTVDPDDPLALRLRVRLAAESDYRNGTHQMILGTLGETMRTGDATARAEALSLAHHCLLGPEHAVLRQAIATELVAESARSGRRVDLLMGLMWQTVDLFLAGDPHAERRLGELRRHLMREDHRAVGFVVSAMDVMLAIRGGRLDEAEGLAHACAQRGAAAGDADATGWYGAQIAAIRWYQGRIGELVPMMKRMVHSPTLSVVDNSYFSVLAVAAATAGDPLTATGALASLRGSALADLPKSSSWLVTLTGVVEAAALLGDAALSAEAYDLLLPHADLPVVASLGVVCFGSVQHALGVASLTIGEVERAAGHFAIAVQRNERMSHWPAVMLSRQRYADALLRLGRQDEARRELDAAGVLRAALPGATALTPTSPSATCVREATNWRVALGNRNVLVSHSVGMLHLAVLLANSDKEIPAVDLVAGVAVLDSAIDGAGGSTQTVLDRTAVQQYRERLGRLRADLDDLEEAGDEVRALKVRAEYNWLMSELAAASGIGGRSRRFADSGERARLAVGKAIRRALARIEEADPLIGQHLRDRVHTGIRCSYTSN